MIQQNSSDFNSPCKRIYKRRISKIKNKEQEKKEQDKIKKQVENILLDQVGKICIRNDQAFQQQFENNILVDYPYSRRKIMKKLFNNWINFQQQMIFDENDDDMEDINQFITSLLKQINEETLEIEDEKKMKLKDLFTLILFFILKNCSYKDFLYFNNEVKSLEEKGLNNIQTIQEIRTLKFVKDCKIFKKICDLFTKCFQHLQISYRFLNEQKISKIAIQEQIDKILSEQVEIFGRENLKQIIFNKFLSQVNWDSESIEDQIIDLQYQLIKEYLQIQEQKFILMDHLEEIILFYVLCYFQETYKEVELFIHQVDFKSTCYQFSDIYQNSPQSFKQAVKNLIQDFDNLQILCIYW